MVDSAETIPTAQVVSIASARTKSVALPCALGGYRLGEKIGQGSTGTVFKCERDDQTLALKLSRLSYSDNGLGAHRSFLNEVGSLVTVDHPNILPVLDVGVEQDWSYIVTPWVKTQLTLKAFGRNGRRLDDGALLQIGVELCDALTALHGVGVIHRDIKPANILLNEHLSPILFDFGIAAWRGQPHYGRLMGTPHYMAPEQVRSMPVSEATDQYGLAITLFELFAGRAAFGECPKEELFQRICNDATPDLSLWRPDLPVELSRILSRAMSKQRDERFASLTAMRHALESVELSPDLLRAEHWLQSTALKPHWLSVAFEPATHLFNEPSGLVVVESGIVKRGRQVLREGGAFWHQSVTPIEFLKSGAIRYLPHWALEGLTTKDQLRFWRWIAALADHSAK
ncbi:MAG: serine/threonine protein kinase [Gammaproteobacteria bacterium]|nr:serine/threonine protein kinase [Gammaproteobacteria bacterium]